MIVTSFFWLMLLGSCHTAIFVDTQEDTFVFGRNMFGELGLNDTTPRLFPTLLDTPFTVASASGGYLHSLILSDEGEVYTFGWNEYGQLGLGDTNDRALPTKIEALSTIRIKEVSAGALHSLALSSEGEVYSFGSNNYGQLGVNTTVAMEPMLITSLSGITIVSISAGYMKSLVLTNTGEVYSFGHNGNGGLGLNDTLDRYEPTLISLLSPFTITAISSGHFHTLALTTEGEVYSFGYNLFGQLGLGDNATRLIPTLIEDLAHVTIVSISAGYVHSLVLSNDGEIFSFGYGEKGQLGLNDNITRYSPELIDSLNGVNIVAIEAAYYHSLVLSDAGNVYAFGDNDDGQLGLNDTIRRLLPTQIDALSDVKIASINCGDAHNFLITGSIISSTTGAVTTSEHTSTGQVGTTGSNISAGTTDGTTGHDITTGPAASTTTESPESSAVLLLASKSLILFCMFLMLGN